MVYGLGFKKKLDVQDRGKGKIFTDHVTQICEAHNLVSVFFIQKVQ